MRKRPATRATATIAPAPVVPPPHPALAPLLRSRWLYALVSLALLAPCYWQQRVQAGDLASHIYNSWLAQLIESGRIQGLVIVRQTTNILFDLMLSGLFKLFGAGPAQRISVSLAVLIFVWGAFAFAAAVSGGRPWRILPCIAMLAYGWVYHMGFFNFYLSLGLCFWALALLWKATPRRVAAAIPILLVAYLAHALPVAWTVCLTVYLLSAGHMAPRRRAYMIAGSLVAMTMLHAVAAGAMGSRWSLRQITLTTGVDQIGVFDGKYYAVLAGLLIVWGGMFLRLMRLSGLRQVVSSMAFQFCAISAAGVFIVPTGVFIPGFHHALVFIAERMSLAVGICICALLAAAPPRRFEQHGMVLLAIVFFGFLYRDERVLNSFEDRVQDAVAALPPGQRVISSIYDPSLRIDALAHMIDRACIGHCYSYANYEPSTTQFRIRSVAENAYVAHTYEDSWLMQAGAYRVKERDLPLYQIDLDAGARIVLRSLPVGAPCGATAWKVLGDLG